MLWQWKKENLRRDPVMKCRLRPRKKKQKKKTEKKKISFVFLTIVI